MNKSLYYLVVDNNKYAINGYTSPEFQQKTINDILDAYPENADWHIEQMHPWL